MDPNTKITSIKDKNTKSDGLVKILLVIITVLLLVLVFVQVPAIKQELLPQPSEMCVKARQLAEDSVLSDLSFIDSYEGDVYGSDVDNINQQIFRVSEYQYFALENLVLQQKALLYMITECQW